MPNFDFSAQLEPLMHAADTLALSVMALVAAVHAAASLNPQALAASVALLLFLFAWLTVMGSEDE